MTTDERIRSINVLLDFLKEVRHSLSQEQYKSVLTKILYRIKWMKENGITS